MSAAVRNRSPVRHSSDSPRRRHLSPGRRSPPYNERSPDRRRTSMKEKSPARNRGQRRSASPARERYNDRAIRSSRDMHDRSPRREKELDGLRSGRHRQSRSPVREKQPQRGRSPISMRPNSPILTSSSPPPSPRTKRLRRAEAEREAEKWVGSEHSRVVVRERHREHREHKDASEEGKSVVSHDRNDGKSSKSTKPGHSVSPNERNRHRRRSPDSPSKAPSSRDRARDEVSNSRAAERPREHVDDSISKMKAAEDALEAKQKQKPSFELSGKLAEETNRVRGVTLLFTEPPDARKPDVRWRLYVFKAGEVLNEPLYLHRQSSYLFGRERRVADVPTDHPSCSKQHAVIQYRLVEKDLPDGLLKKQVRPYLMDLGSTNGTFINDNRIEPQRYYELVEKDTIRFGNSSREYVLLHENSVQ